MNLYSRLIKHTAAATVQSDAITIHEP